MRDMIHIKKFFKKLLSNFTNEIISAYPEYYKAYELLSKVLELKKKICYLQQDLIKH